MFDGRWMGLNFMEWSHGGWHGFFGFHALISLIGITVIVFAVVALVRDWRDAHRSRLAADQGAPDRDD